MLFTDGIILSTQDLRAHDNNILEIASTESIELSSKLAIAQRAIGYELSAFLAKREPPVGLHRVVVNDELRDLLAIHTLAAVYRDAYNRHLNDRYLGRVKDFSQASERSLLRFLQNGVGITNTPVGRAEQPFVMALEDGGLDGGVYLVEIAWQHAAGRVGERSTPVSIEIVGGSLLVAAPPAPANITGWHVFIGGEDQLAARQNDEVLPLDAPWTQAAALRTDVASLEPSGPDFYVRQGDQMVRR